MGKGRVRFLAGPCGSFGGQSGNGLGLCSETLAFTFQWQFTDAPHPYSVHLPRKLYNFSNCPLARTPPTHPHLAPVYCFKNSVRHTHTHTHTPHTHTHSLYTEEFTSVLLHMLNIKLLFNNCFIQRQFM